MKIHKFYFLYVNKYCTQKVLKCPDNNHVSKFILKKGRNKFKYQLISYPRIYRCVPFDINGYKIALRVIQNTFIVNLFSKYFQKNYQKENDLSYEYTIIFYFSVFHVFISYLFKNKLKYVVSCHQTQNFRSFLCTYWTYENVK